MPVGEIAGELLGGLLRLLVYVLVDIVFELLIKGSGYGICRIFTKKVDPDGVAAIITGIGFWAVIGFIGYALYKGVT